MHYLTARNVACPRSRGMTSTQLVTALGETTTLAQEFSHGGTKITLAKSLVTGGQNAARTGTKPSKHKICGRCELRTVVRQRCNAACAYID